MFVALQTRVDAVVESLTEDIFSGTAEPGDSLRELHLARNLKVSQQTIRAALVKLEHLGLVDRISRKGTVVKNLTREDLAERIQVRIPLDQMACVIVARQMDKKHFDRLRQLADSICAATRPDGDAAFHRYIWELTDNRTLYQTLDQLSAPLFAGVTLLRQAGLQNLEARVTSHHALISAMMERSDGEIRTIVRDHTIDAYSAFLDSGYLDFRSLAEQLKRESTRAQRPSALKALAVAWP
jgi:DNA-binding GntR family transcriptional regulator